MVPCPGPPARPRALQTTVEERGVFRHGLRFDITCFVVVGGKQRPQIETDELAG
jgi:hypothetical protein